MICLYLAQVPPLWFYAINPRVQAARDASVGKTNNEVSFNNIQKPTAKDKQIDLVVSIYFGAVTLFFGWLMCYGDLRLKDI